MKGLLISSVPMLGMCNEGDIIKKEIHVIDPQQIAVVDDTPAYRVAAAGALMERFPHATLHLFSSAGKMLDALRRNAPPYNLLFSDLHMGWDRAGFQVSRSAWSWNIPVVLVAGPIDGNIVRIGCSHRVFQGNKSDPRVWTAVLKEVFDDPGHEGTLTALRTGRFLQPQSYHGEISMHLTSQGVRR